MAVDEESTEFAWSDWLKDDNTARFGQRAIPESLGEDGEVERIRAYHRTYPLNVSCWGKQTILRDET